MDEIRNQINLMIKTKLNWRKFELLKSFPYLTKVLLTTKFVSVMLRLARKAIFKIESLFQYSRFKVSRFFMPSDLALQLGVDMPEWVFMFL